VTLGRYDEAVGAYRRALVLESDNPAAIAGLSTALERSGQYRHARDVLRPLLERGNRHPQLAVAFAAVARHTGEEMHAVKLIEELAGDTSSTDMCIDLHFAAGNLLDRMQCYDQAFGHYEQANAACGYVYLPGTAERDLAPLMAFYSAQAGKRRPRSGNRSELPVFIVGMPRSGTTLVEQILASHTAVKAGGELEVIPEIVSGIPALVDSPAPYPDCLDGLTRRNIEQPARHYIAALADIGAGAKRVTDKLPYNFINLGLIDQLLPSVRVVHCVRDPKDIHVCIHWKPAGREAYKRSCRQRLISSSVSTSGLVFMLLPRACAMTWSRPSAARP